MPAGPCLSSSRDGDAGCYFQDRNDTAGAGGPGGRLTGAWRAAFSEPPGPGQPGGHPGAAAVPKGAAGPPAAMGLRIPHARGFCCVGCAWGGCVVPPPWNGAWGQQGGWLVVAAESGASAEPSMRQAAARLPSCCPAVAAVRTPPAREGNAAYRCVPFAFPCVPRVIRRGEWEEDRHQPTGRRGIAPCRAREDMRRPRAICPAPRGDALSASRHARLEREQSVLEISWFEKSRGSTGCHGSPHLPAPSRQTGQQTWSGSVEGSSHSPDARPSRRCAPPGQVEREWWKRSRPFSGRSAWVKNAAGPSAATRGPRTFPRAQGNGATSPHARPPGKPEAGA